TRWPGAWTTGGSWRRESRRRSRSAPAPSSASSASGTSSSGEVGNCSPSRWTGCSGTSPSRPTRCAPTTESGRCSIEGGARLAPTVALSQSGCGRCHLGVAQTATPMIEEPQSRPQRPATPEDSFDRLFASQYGKVVAVANRVLADRAEAEDVAQEVCWD